MLSMFASTSSDHTRTLSGWFTPELASKASRFYGLMPPTVSEAINLSAPALLGEAQEARDGSY